jgi:hypothetical protein
MANDSQRPSAFPNNGSKIAHPKIDALRKDPAALALIDKLVAAGNTPNGSTPFANRGIDLPNDSLLRKVADITATNVNDAASMFQLLPDTELAMQILVSCILSPEDMMETNLIYTSNMDIKDAELSAALLDTIKGYFDNVYKIRPLLTSWLKDSLFLIGCYPMVILPENVLDAAINSSANVSMESLSGAFDRHGRLPHVGVLGNSTVNDKNEGSNYRGFSLESFREANDSLAYSPDVTIALESYNNLVDNTKLATDKDTKWSPYANKLKAALTLEKFELSVTDNPNVLKLPLVDEAVRAQRVHKAFSKIRLSTESDSVMKTKEQISIPELERELYRFRRYKNVPVLPLMPVSDAERPTVGHPLVMKLPSESMIPVHVPSNPEQHLGYFIMLDVNGNPLTRASQTDYYTDLTTNLNANQEMVSQLLATTKRAEFGRETNREIDQDEIMRVYSELVERDLMSRLRNGIYGENVEITRPTEIYRVMLSRALAKMHTQLLYIPAEFVTYVAFDYNKYGVGMSLLQKNKVIGGMRAMILFANTMAAVKNSIQRVVLNITLDPDDPQPANTVEFLLHEYAKTRQASYPLGASNPLDIISFLQNAGVEVMVSGNTRYPETKMALEDKTSSHAKPDSELEDSLRKRFLQGIGLTPEMVDAGAATEFATTVVRNNLIMAKRVKDYQERLMHFVQEFIQKYTIHSSILMDELIKLVEANEGKIPQEYRHEPKGEEGQKVKDHASPAQRYLSEFLKTLETSLPAPDVAEQATQFEAYAKFVEFLDKVLEAYIDPESLDQSEFGEYASVMPSILKTVRSYFMRQYIREKGIMPELDDLVTLDEKNMPRLNLFDVQANHTEGLMKSIGEYIKKMLKFQKAHPMPSNEPPPDETTGGGAPQGGYDENGTQVDGGEYDADGNYVGAPDETAGPDAIADDGSTPGNPTDDTATGLDEAGNPIADNEAGSEGATGEADVQDEVAGQEAPGATEAATGEAAETPPASGEEGAPPTEETPAETKEQTDETTDEDQQTTDADEEASTTADDESAETETTEETAASNTESQTDEQEAAAEEEPAASKAASGTEATDKEEKAGSEKSSGEEEETPE